jgi:predicted nucleic acid-binding protein
VTLIIDTGPLVALGDRADPHRPEVRALLRESSEELVIPAPVTAEVDYLLAERFGRHARRAFLEDLAARRFRVACLEEVEYATIVQLDHVYADLNLGLADLSIVVIAERFRTQRIVTFDERDFRSVRPLQGGAFTLLPADRE